MFQIHVHQNGVSIMDQLEWDGEEEAAVPAFELWSSNNWYAYLG